MDCAGFDELFLSTVAASPLLSAHFPADARHIIASSMRQVTNIYLDTLSKLSTNPIFSSYILTCYEPLFPELVARWRTHSSLEQVVVSFGSVLPVVPYLSELAEFYLSQNLEGEKNILSNILESKEERDVLRVLIALHRLLQFKRDVFLCLVDAPSLYRLLQDHHRPIRYLAVRILSIYLGTGDAMQEEMFSKHGVGRSSAPVLGAWEDREIDFGFLTIFEAKRLLDLAERLRKAKEERSVPTHSRVIQPSDLSPLISDMCGVLIPHFREASPHPTAIIDTPTTRSNIHPLAVALRHSKPLLVTGYAGSGKTGLIQQIASSLGALDSMVSVHLGDQSDAKLLLGAYTTAVDSPGSFEWRPGVLTTAVREGRWVLVEDIDKAPTEVLGVLLPLIESGELLLPNRGQKIQAARGFRLVATVRTSPSAKAETPTVNLLGNRLWSRVDLQMPSLSELEAIVTGRYPSLGVIAQSIISVYTIVQQLYQETTFLAISKSTLGRQISPKDLFKWCNRLEVLFASAGVKTGEIVLSSGLYDEIFSEAVDCFASNLPTAEARRMVATRIAGHLHVPSQRLDLFFSSHMPSLTDSERAISIGRAQLWKKTHSMAFKRRKTSFGRQSRPFATTSHALRLMEQVGVAIRLAEPVLLVGETGTGKTTVVQHLAELLGFNLTVINLSQQTESGDLLGGFKPVDVKSLAVPLKETFEHLFDYTFSAKKNKRFIDVMAKCWAKQQWKSVIRLWIEAIKMAEDSLAKLNQPEDAEVQKKKKRRLNRVENSALKAQWAQFSHGVAAVQRQSSRLSKSFVFSFVEGCLVRAARNGDWVLLDEINLASSDTLENIADLLKDGGKGSIILSEKGDVEKIQAHPDFRIFACMNPATDVGKRDLPPSIRSRFTELYVVSPDSDFTNLIAIVKEYIGHLATEDDRVLADVVHLYLEAKQLAESHKLVDGANQKPHFSMRTLTRTLSYVSEISSIYGLRRGLYEGFCMSFLTFLDRASERILLPIIGQYILGSQRNVRSLINQIPQMPADGDDYVQFRHYWTRKGALEPQEQPHYIITPFVERNMLNLVRATATRKFPVLIQGPTSSGKTSMIEYLAKRTGNKFVRINNHEHTDLQEYMGMYVSDQDDNLRFREGILVEALRNGHWIVLDELNLAPTDVLESLNRLLDDNRELLVPETQEVVHPHRNFMLFATQNPPGIYGGRKILSRAFRNRFLELHFDDIPEDELGTILKERCQIAPSYCEKIVKVYRELSLLRQSIRLFEQKNSFVTLRDLFRWANREAVGYQQLAENGYMLLAERVRKDDEKLAVKVVIEKIMNVKIDETSLYAFDKMPEYALYIQKSMAGEVVWTKAMMRLFSLVARALWNQEPVLIVGETGCGKTTVCQMLADASDKRLIIVNAHQNTETGDIIGAQRPKRNRSVYQAELVRDLIAALTNVGQTLRLEEIELSDMLGYYEGLDAKSKELIPVEVKERIDLNQSRSKGLFEWADGPLIHAMKDGFYFLLDEISLADDSVLERLNSALEPERTILLAEKGPIESQIRAAPGFQFLATMNPGGDYGKKELSPALRSRFTEIWVPSMTDYDDMFQIVRSKLKSGSHNFAEAIVRYSQWFRHTYNFSNTSSISIRDILSWISFINIHAETNPAFGMLHGAALVYFDGLGANPAGLLSISGDHIAEQRNESVKKLSELVGHDLLQLYSEVVQVSASETSIRLGSFSMERTAARSNSVSFNLTAPTTAMNAMRIIRAMQLRRPILLEGSPGVGKTSLINALANASGNPLTRINLSEQTDLVDLFGSDVPAEGGRSGEFAWRDAPFLRAMQEGHWVLLDEMNLASQSVLEGLNACLDHRGQAYVAELDRTFTCHSNFKVFAAQNPHYQGGGRKGLPASFVNRFTVVYAEPLGFHDLHIISTALYPSAPADLVEKVIKFVVTLDRELAQKRSFGATGGPWEFNLRDTLRWLELLSSTNVLPAVKAADEFVDIIIKQRFRTPEDRKRVDQIFESVFGYLPAQRQLYHVLTEETLQIGHAVLQRQTDLQHIRAHGLAILKEQLPVLETLMTCIQKSMPCILVGPSGTGKSSVIQLVAGLVGAELDQLALNNEVDTTDIVGGFEQVDLSRNAAQLMTDLERVVRRMTVQIIHRGKVPHHRLSQMLKICRSNRVTDEERLTLLSSHLLDAATTTGELSPFVKAIDVIVAEARNVGMARFEWIDGMLIRAAEQGRWLVLDNANLCSPSVLDRLNSLLEVGGNLTVNEHCSPSGDPKVITPHPNFRLFITMDPKYGELSRAMRNRCVEVYMGSYSDLPNVAQQDDARVHELINYSVSTEADALAFQYLERMTEVNIPQPVYRGLLHAVLEHTPKPSVCALSRFSTQVSSTAEERRTGDIINQFINLTECSSIQSSARAVLQAIGEGLELTPTLNNAQSVVPIRNPYLTASMNFADVITHFTIYEVTRLVLEIEEIEDGILQKSATVKMADMTFLEKSASRRGKAKGFGGSVGSQLFEFLSTIRKVLKDWINSSYPPTGVESAREIVHLWRDLVKISDATNLDESIFQVYLWLFDRWIHTARGVFSESHLSAVDSSLRAFKVPLHLVTGLSMELMWEIMRPSVPKSLDGWEQFMALKALMERFDHVATDGDLAIALSTKKALIYAMIALLTENADVSGLVTEMAASIELLEASRVSELRIADPGSLKSAFDVLLYSRTVSGAGISDNILRLAHFAGRPTVDILGYSDQRSALRTGYDQFLQDIWASSQAKRRQEANRVLGCGIPTEMLRIRDASKGSAIGRLTYLDPEIQEILSQFAQHTTSIANDKLLQIFEKLMGNLKKIFLAHAEHFMKSAAGRTTLEAVVSGFDEGPGQKLRSQQAFVSIRAALNFLDDTHLHPIIREHLHPLVDALDDVADRPPTERTCTLGVAWVHYGLACLKLYVPNCALDPAMKSMIQRERFLSRLAELHSEIEAERLFELTFTGQDDNRRIQILQHRVHELGDEPEHPVVARPIESQMLSLQADFSNLLQSVVAAEPHNRLLPALLARSENYKEQEKLLQMNLARVGERLLKGYPVYKDIVDPVLGFIYSLRLGLSMVVTDTGSNLDCGAFLDPIHAQIIKDVASGVRTDSKLLALRKYSARSCIEGFGRFERSSKDSILAILHSLFKQWKVDTEEEKENAAQKASTYRYRGAEQQFDPQEFKTMFPDFSEEDGHSQLTGDDPDTRTPVHHLLASRIAQCHSALFLGKHGLDLSLQSLVSDGAQLWLQATNGGANLQSYQIEEFLPAILLSLNDTKEWVNGRRRDLRPYDFYSDENIAEAHRVVTIVHKVIKRIAKLAELWPENVTLQDAFEACQQLLEFPNSTPVAKLITKVEKLHGILDEWQSVASSEYSVAEHCDAFTQLIISWRKLELTTWPHLFDQEDGKARQSALSWWFFLYESVVANPLSLLREGRSLYTHTKILIESLSSFVSTCSVGQYLHRLQLLQVFEQHILSLADDYPGLEVVYRGIHNFISYYSQYRSAIQDSLAQNRKKAEKEVADVVLLASWKDTNIIALRDSAKRSHHKLYKTVRRYRQGLENSVAPLLHTLPNLDKVSQLQPAINTAVSFDADAVTLTYTNLVKVWDARPARLRDLLAATNTMLRVSQIPDVKLNATVFMDQFSTSIVSTIQELQAETPAILTEDNKDTIKHLKTRKRKAFTETLQELRQMGIISNPSRAILRKQATLDDILASVAPMLNSTDNIDTSGAQAIFLRVVEAVFKARAAAEHPSEDLERNEVARCIGFMEHLLAVNIEQRSTLASSLTELINIRIALEKCEELAKLDVHNLPLFVPGSISVTTVSSIRKTMQWMPKMLDFTTDLIQIHCKATGRAVPDIDALLSEWKDLARNLTRRLISEKVIHPRIWQSSAKKAADECVRFLTSVIARIGNFRTQFADVSYTLTPLLRWVSRDDVHEVPNEETADLATVQDLDEVMEKLSDSILVALQRLRSENLKRPEGTETAGWFLQDHIASTAALKSLHMSHVFTKLENAISFVSRLQPFHPNISHAIRAIFASYAPIVQQYVNICHRSVQRTTAAHQSICKATYVLCTTATTLFSKGFCQPAEQGDEKGENGGEVKTGTGLGEGEGADDISKDVGADEDMSELAQQQNKEERENEIQDEEDAVDMAGEDMEGEMGDKEQKEGGDEDGGKEMDEEVGDVDDLDPTAVDEKTWDADADEDLKEKEGGDVQTKQKSGDELEAKRDGKEGKQGEVAEEQDEIEGEGEGADLDDEVEQQDTEAMDQHVPDVETLNLPDDLNLDGDGSEEEKGDVSDDDLNMDDLSDAEEEDEALKDAEADSKDEKFPEFDAPEQIAEYLEQMEGDEQGDENNAEQGDGVQDDDEVMDDSESQPEEPDSLLQTRDEDKSKQAEETAPSEVKGAEGGAGPNDSNEQASAQEETGDESNKPTEQQTNSSSDPQSSKQDQAAGKASSQEQQAETRPSQAEDNSEQESEFRKVGDILEKWHRQRREILNAKENEEEKPAVDKMELGDPEFEHLPSDEARADTQALGTTTEEQASALDESMAIDSGVKEPKDAFEDDEPAKDHTEEQPEVVEHSKQDAPEANGEDESSAARVIVGDSTSNGPRERNVHDEEDAMDLDTVDEAALMDLAVHDPLTEFTITRPSSEARALWQKYESTTRTLSAALCEQLRLILEPTVATKMRGDFRTGKRLNMRRILPYIASDYKKDKIWMRRAKPSKRQYQVILAVDDSKSMAEGGGSELALETVALVARALSSLEVGQISVLSFGETTRVVHGFETPFTSESGVSAFARFTFSQQKTDVRALVETSLSLFSNARLQASTDLWQLEIVVSDGVCEDHDTLRRLVRKAQEQRVMIVFVIVDSVRENSILELNRVSFVGGEIKTERYLDGFPFGYYLVVQDVRELPGVLSGALRQWFAESVESAR